MFNKIYQKVQHRQWLSMNVLVQSLKIKYFLQIKKLITPERKLYHADVVLNNESGQALLKAKLMMSEKQEKDVHVRSRKHTNHMT